MKKIFNFLLIIIILFGLTGCISNTFQYTFPYDYTEVTSMKIYNIEDHLGYGNINEIDLLLPLKTIDPENYKEIMETIEKMEFKIVILLIASAPSPEDTYYGYLLRVEYSTGEESLLCDGLRVDYYNSGENIGQRYGTNKEFAELLKKHL